MPPVARRAALTLAIAVVVLVLLGVTYQGVTTAFERRDYPPPGHRIDAGGHQLHLYCTGTGHAPAVILEAPEGGLSAMWGLVQPTLSAHSRVCAYDRAGLGWSESGDAPFDPRAVPAELRAVLAREHVLPPYVFIGQSMGAVLARVYASRYPNDVVGLVLIDDPVQSHHPLPEAEVAAFRRRLAYAPWLARTGVLRLARLFSAARTDLPPASAGAVASFLTRPDHLTRASDELGRWDDTMALAAAGPVPARVRIVHVETAHPAAGAFLGARADADRVTTAATDLLLSVQ